MRGYAATAAALLALSLDRAEGAIAHLEPLRARVLSSNEPTVFQWEADLVEAYLRVGAAGTRPQSSRALNSAPW